MTCNSWNQQPQKYRLTYPEKNTSFYTSTPPPNYGKQLENQWKTLQFTPSTCNQCASTFSQPWNQNDPLKCLKSCQAIDAYKIDACEFENSLKQRGKRGGFCISEPSASLADYTNIPMIEPIIIGPGCGKNEVKRLPNVPEYGLKYSSAYNPVEWEYGLSYDY